MNRRSEKRIEIKEAMDLMEKVKSNIEDVIYSFGYGGDNIIAGDTLDEEFERTELLRMLDKLEDVYYIMKNLRKPVIEQGFIKHNAAKRYELPSGDYFTSGSPIEVLRERNGEQWWVASTVEYNGDDYYIVALGKDTNIDGMMCRIRK